MERTHPSTVIRWADRCLRAHVFSRRTRALRYGNLKKIRREFDTASSFHTITGCQLAGPGIAAATRSRGRVAAAGTIKLQQGHSPTAHDGVVASERHSRRASTFSVRADVSGTDHDIIGAPDRMKQGAAILLPGLHNLASESPWGPFSVRQRSRRFRVFVEEPNGVFVFGLRR